MSTELIDSVEKVKKMIQEQNININIQISKEARKKLYSGKVQQLTQMSLKGLKTSSEHLEQPVNLKINRQKLLSLRNRRQKVKKNKQEKYQVATVDRNSCVFVIQAHHRNNLWEGRFVLILTVSESFCPSQQGKHGWACLLLVVGMQDGGPASTRQVPTSKDSPASNSNPQRYHLVTKDVSVSLRGYLSYCRHNRPTCILQKFQKQKRKTKRERNAERNLRK